MAEHAVGDNARRLHRTPGRTLVLVERPIRDQILRQATTADHGLMGNGRVLLAGARALGRQAGGEATIDGGLEIKRIAEAFLRFRLGRFGGRYRNLVVDSGRNAAAVGTAADWTCERAA